MILLHVEFSCETLCVAAGYPNSAIDVGAVDTRREIRERIFIRHVSHNVVDAVHTATPPGWDGM